ncbi:CAP domain-containing protein [Bacillus pinisoli]|uniref:CAP domain-containing protein n=1 Tax=Bacillus pinisoli TaxID=2901866 RepID=UPI001FF1809A|nr:CAP domain-containing protein [Bacillus pinisoli]
MRKISLILSLLLLLSFFSLYSQWDSSITNDETLVTIQESASHQSTSHSLETNIISAHTEEKYNGIQNLLGLSGDEIIQKWGEPTRMDPSSYEYMWWIYKLNEHSYVQVGVLDNKVVTIYGTGDDVNIDPFYIGQPYEEIAKNFILSDQHSFKVGENTYRFELSEEEQHVRPLIQLGNVWVQLYVDQFTNRLSSIRFMDASTLIKQRPYELVYRGELINARDLSQEEWKAIELGSAQQIIDITNMIRKRHKVNDVKWHEPTSQVAFLHSMDMMKNGYFSHDSPTAGGLADRLEAGKIKYHLAGENIAAKYVDGIAAVEGWLNSEGHRETLLNNKFTHLGVGVYEKYYTQNFISTWEPKK